MAAAPASSAPDTHASDMSSSMEMTSISWPRTPTGSRLGSTPPPPPTVATPAAAAAPATFPDAFRGCSSSPFIADAASRAAARVTPAEGCGGAAAAVAGRAVDCSMELMVSRPVTVGLSSSLDSTRRSRPVDQVSSVVSRERCVPRTCCSSRLGPLLLPASPPPPLPPSCPAAPAPCVLASAASCCATAAGAPEGCSSIVRVSWATSSSSFSSWAAARPNAARLPWAGATGPGEAALPPGGSTVSTSHDRMTVASSGSTGAPPPCAKAVLRVRARSMTWAGQAGGSGRGGSGEAGWAA